jgi:hypothetical protein
MSPFRGTAATSRHPASDRLILLPGLTAGMRVHETGQIEVQAMLSRPVRCATKSAYAQRLREDVGSAVST